MTPCVRSASVPGQPEWGGAVASLLCEWGEKGGKEIRREKSEVMEVWVVKLERRVYFSLFILVGDVA